MAAAHTRPHCKPDLGDLSQVAEEYDLPGGLPSVAEGFARSMRGDGGLCTLSGRRSLGLGALGLAGLLAFAPIPDAVVEASEAPTPGAIAIFGNGISQLTSTPPGKDYVQVAVGQWHAVALKSDGSLYGWGANNNGANNPPTGNNFVAVAAAYFYGLALRDDGTLAGWGINDYGQSTVPAGSDYKAIEAGRYHALAIRTDGSLVGWGRNDYGEATPPAGNDYVAIAAGNGFSVALRSDGSLVGWGNNAAGSATPPAGTDYVAIAAGYGHAIALKADGSLVAWGNNTLTQTVLPPGSNFAAIAAGGNHTIALRTDGTLVIWGNQSMTSNVGNGYIGVASGDDISIGINPDQTPPIDPSIVSTSHTVGAWSNRRNLTVEFQGASDPESAIKGYSYVLDQVPDTVPDMITDTISPGPPPVRQTTQADGQWWYHVRTLDWAGNWSAGVHAGPYKIDRTVPASPTLTTTSHVLDQTSTDTTVDLIWSGASDGGSGLAGYSIYWYGNPDETVDLPSDATGTTSPRLWNGWWSFKLRTVDVAGNWSQAVTIGSFVINTPVPVTSITGGPADRATIATHSTSFSFAANESVTFYCSDDHIGGGAYHICTSPHQLDNLNDGSHGFAVHGVDEDGNSSNYIFRTIYVDTTAPNVYFTSGPADGSTITSSTASYGFAADSGNYFYCSVDGGSASACIPPVQLTNLLDGSHAFSVYATDVANNTSAVVTRTVVVDTTGPAVSFTAGPAHGAIIGSSSPSFSFSAEAGATFKCSLDGESASACTSPVPLSSVEEGAHAFSVYATDQFGNAGALAIRTFTVDTLPPDNPGLLSNSHTVGTLSADRTVDVAWAGASDAGAGVDGFSFSWTNASDTTPDTTKDAEQGADHATSSTLNDGGWWFHLRTRDNAGRWSDPIHLGPFVIGTVFQPDEAIQLKGDAAFLGAGIINGDAASQTRTVNSARGTSRTFLVRLINGGSAADQFELAGSAAPAGFKIRYLKGKTGTTDITSQILGGTYLTGALAPGKNVFVRVVITVRNTAAHGSSFGALLTATSLNNDAQIDAVKAVVRFP